MGDERRPLSGFLPKNNQFQWIFSLCQVKNGAECWAPPTFGGSFRKRRMCRFIRRSMQKYLQVSQFLKINFKKKIFLFTLKGTTEQWIETSGTGLKKSIRGRLNAANSDLDFVPFDLLNYSISPCFFFLRNVIQRWYVICVCAVSWRAVLFGVSNKTTKIWSMWAFHFFPVRFALSRTVS